MYDLQLIMKKLDNMQFDIILRTLFDLYLSLFLY